MVTRFALAGMLLPFCAFSELTDWFSEDVNTFTNDVNRQWRYQPGGADAVGERIAIADDGAVFTPGAAAGAYIVGEHEVTFDSASATFDDVVADAVGIQLVEVGDDCRFAVLEPQGDAFAWTPTAVAAQLGVGYVIRIEQDYTGEGRVIAYSYRETAAAEFLPIATVRLPATAGVPAKVVYSGKGTVKRMSAQVSVKNPDPYNRWRNCGGLLTWAGYGGSSTARDAKSEYAVYKEWVKSGDSWGDGSVWTGETAFVKFPMPAFRFVKGDTTVPKTIGASFSPLVIGGLMVEAGASSYKFQQAGAYSTAMGDSINGGVSWFVINESFFILRKDAAVTLYGDVNIDIAESKIFQLNPAASLYPTKLDPSTHTKLRLHGKGKLQLYSLDARGPVVIDYSDVTSGDTSLLGKLIIDDDTSFILPDTLTPGTGFKLCSSTVEGGGSGSVIRSITIGGKTMSAEVTIAKDTSDNKWKLVYQPLNYSRYAANPGVFTWTGNADRFEQGTFCRFDCAKGTDTADEFTGDARYSTIPGWETVPVNCFWWVFADSIESSGMAPFAQGAGYVLRFAGQHGVGKLIKTSAGVLNLGGLIVENGAHDYGISSGSSAYGTVQVGVDSTAVTNRIEIGEDFQLQNKMLDVVGTVELNIDAGKRLTVSGTESGVVPMMNSRNRPVLKFSGAGEFVCNRLKAMGSCTLDFSALPVSRATPYLNGALEISELARLIFPATLSQNTSYRICTGDLYATSGVYPVARGTGEFALANVTFDTAQQTARFAEISASDYNQRQLSDATATWSAIAGGFAADKPVVLTLTKNVTLIVDQAVNIPQLLVLGKYRLSLVLRENPTLGKVFCGRSASVELVYDPQCKNFGKSLTVLSGVAYDVVIEGSADESLPAQWAGAITVEGRLTTRGHVWLVDDENTSDQVAIEPGAVVTVESGSLSFAPETPIEEVTFNLSGKWKLGDADWQPGEGVVINFLSGGKLIGGTTTGITATEPMKLTVDTGVKTDLEVKISSYDTLACRLPVGSQLTLKSNLSGVGADSGLAVYGLGSVKQECQTTAFAHWTFAQGGITGAGEAVFHGDPVDSGASASLQSATRWTGNCHLIDAELSDFNPDNYGNAGSQVTLEGCSGYFARNLTAAETLLNLTNSSTYAYSLDVDNGYDGSQTVLGRLGGDGLLNLRARGSERHRVFLSSLGQYRGSLSVTGMNNHNAIVLGALDPVERQSTFADYDGTVLLQKGEVTLASGASWSANEGIWLKADTTLIDQGTLASAVRGEGTVKYLQNLWPGQPEAAAAFGDALKWNGNVHFDSLTLYGPYLSNCGNPQSRITFSAVDGWLRPQRVDSEIVLQDSGLKVTSAQDMSEVEFTRVSGTGALEFGTGIDNRGWSYRLWDVFDFNGSLRMEAENGKVLIGDAERTSGSGIEVADGYCLRSERDWSAPLVHFGPTLKVDGEVGDALLRATGGDGDYSYVRVTLVNSDPRRRYALDFDAANKLIYIVNSVTPPTATVDDVFVSYGVDMTNAFVSVGITDYWSGYDFTGRTLAEVFVYDANGNVVASSSGVIVGDGTNVIGVVDLPDGRGRDYRYEVRISTESSTSSGEFVDGKAVQESGVHFSRGWIAENAQTYAATEAAQKTGTWAAPADATIQVEDNRINVVTTGEAGNRLKFTPYRDSSNDVVTATALVRFNGAFNEGQVPVADNSDKRLAALSVIQLPGAEGKLAYAGWVADDSLAAGGSFVTLFGHEDPQVGETTEVSWTVNYRTGYISYTAAGAVLTNAEGMSHFALSSARTLRADRVLFRGSGEIERLDADELNGNLARVASESVTNEYETVDQAVAAAIAGGTTNVTLLWDASWHPTAAELGRTLVFDSEDSKYELFIDGKTKETLERSGYRVIENGGGSYTIDVIEFAIDFRANGGEGLMPSQYYSVTNMIFNLASNEFENVGKDFAFWNAEADGSGSTNWTDGAEIDMTPYGLTNLILYAQWRVAVRTITIEAADEFVYIENVMTNGAVHANVRYFRQSESQATGRAEVPLEHGSDLTIRYSTDLEKELTFDFLAYRSTWTGTTVPYASEPVIKAAILTPMQIWALSHGVTLEELANCPYSDASYRLNQVPLIQETSEVRISDFQVTAAGCSFVVKIDGAPISSEAEIAPMIRISSNLTDWRTPADGEVTVGDGGRVSVNVSGSGNFVKIVIPKNS